MSARGYWVIPMFNSVPVRGNKIESGVRKDYGIWDVLSTVDRQMKHLLPQYGYRTRDMCIAL
jgi:hypothetical protein